MTTTVPMRSVNWTTMGARQLGRMWRHRMRQAPLPRARAAATCSVCFTPSTALWVMRAKPGMVLMPTAMTTLTMPGPSALTTAMARRKPGKARMTSTRRIRPSSRYAAAIGGDQPDEHAPDGGDERGAERHAERDPRAVEDAGEDVAPELVAPEPVAPRGPLERAVEPLLDRIVGRHPRPRHRHGHEEAGDDQPHHRAPVSLEPPPRLPSRRLGLRRSRRPRDRRSSTPSDGSTLAAHRRRGSLTPPSPSEREREPQPPHFEILLPGTQRVKDTAFERRLRRRNLLLGGGSEGASSPLRVI